MTVARCPECGAALPAPADGRCPRCLFGLASQAGADDAAGLPADKRFGDYELVERIGQGGFGVVFRARQQGLDRFVAVKLLRTGTHSKCGSLTTMAFMVVLNTLIAPSFACREQVHLRHQHPIFASVRMSLSTRGW